MTVEKIQRPFHPGEVAPASQPKNRPAAELGSFAEVLKSKLEKPRDQIRFSAHAADRLASRNIRLTEHDMARLNNAAQKIEAKGGKESLMVMGDMAFIVNVRNRTVVTAMASHEGTGANEKIFTNIDSALIINSNQ